MAQLPNHVRWRCVNQNANSANLGQPAHSVTTARAYPGAKPPAPAVRATFAAITQHWPSWPHTSAAH